MCAVPEFPFEKSMSLVLQCRDYVALCGYLPGIERCGPFLDIKTYSELNLLPEDSEFIKRCSNERCLALQVQVVYLIQEWTKLLESNIVGRGDVDASSVQNPDFNKVQESYVTQLCELLNILLGKSSVLDEEWNKLQFPDYETCHTNLYREIQDGKFNWEYYSEHLDDLLGPSDDPDAE